MSKQQLLVYPSIQELPYRGRIDPYIMNLMLRSIEESTLRSILRGSESQDLLSDLALAVNTSYQGLVLATEEFNEYSHIAPGNFYATSFGLTSVSGHVDAVMGLTTLAWDPNRQYTKIPRYSSTTTGPADTVSPNVTIYVDGVQRTTDDKAYNCLNRNNESFWVEQATAGTHTIEIDLPPSLNKNFNYIEISPMPVFGMTISGVQYQDIYGNYQTIFDMENPGFYTASGPIIMHLSPRQTNGTFKIIVNVLPSVLAMGFSCIDIALIDYKDEVETIYFPFENLPTPPNPTYHLGDFTLDFYIDGTTAWGDYIREVSIVNSNNVNVAQPVTAGPISPNTIYHFGGKTITLNTTDKKNLYLKITMKKSGSTTPVIRGCQLKATVTY